MCGIAGAFDARASREWLTDTAVAMGDAIRHRGPDAGGVWVDESAGVALAHRRLSILDLSPLGSQPMRSASGRYVISYNGEVYNFVELRDELASGGAQFRGGSDTEVLLAAFERWGIEAAVRRFIGMFAFAVWDARQRELVLVRDRLGVKPLYWAQSGGLFLFGSELKALLACGAWTPNIDRNAVAAYLRWNYVPSPLCILEGAAKLEPGCMLTVTAGGERRIQRYWSMIEVASRGLTSPSTLDDKHAEEVLNALLLDSVKRRMISDVPLGAFLSGGIDSSLVVALMQAQSARPVRSYTIGFRDDDYNEAVHAKRVAVHIGTEHTELYVGPQDALAVIPSLPHHYDEPFADSSQINAVLVSTLTRQHVTVALSGDGGDELFAGYTRYHWADMIRRRFLTLPSAVRRTLAAVLSVPPAAFWESGANLLPGARRPHRPAERALKLAGFLREPDADSIYRRQHSHWLAPEDIVIGGREPKGAVYDDRLQQAAPEFLERMQLMDTLSYLPDDILTKVDRASMAVGLETREPLLDHRLVEFAWTLPRRMKVRGGVDKWLLRRVLYRYVPQELLERPKKGFGVPMRGWLRGPLRDWAETLLSAQRLQDSGVLNPAPIRAAWRDFLAGRNANPEALWGVLMFEAWRERYRTPLGRSAAGARPARLAS